ncbi:type IX secretion system sortase PorU [Limibacter armeniacum]|uniref:type IX secretion system sortase PorU n=1 Tax=Limibacter armeniacum TaxID=466084 RepID=UPI002FE64F21
MADGELYKLEVEKTGIYKIDANMLVTMGVDLNNLNPKNLSILGNPGGMLAQANNVDRYQGLQENAIWVKGEEDGRFDESDYILFYAEGPDAIYYDSLNDFLRYELNLYSNANYYYLKIGDSEGERLSQAESNAYEGTPIQNYIEVIHHEEELQTALSEPSGRYWLGETFDTQLSRNFSHSTQAIANEPIKLLLSVAAKSRSESAFTANLNGKEIGEIHVDGASSYNSYKYGRQGNIQELQMEAVLSSSAEIDFQVSYNKPDTDSKGYLNFYTLNVPRKLALNGDFNDMYFPEALEQSSVAYNITGVDNTLQIWDLSDPVSAKKLPYQLSGSNGIFVGKSNGSVPHFIAFQGADFPNPTFVSKVSNQDLYSISVPDMLIVVYDEFEAEAQRLADFRLQHDNLKVEVVKVSQIYNEFSSGKQDVVAIRDFVKVLYQKSTKLKYLLLFGDASYDYKSLRGIKGSLVPVYEAREVFYPTKTFSSDDFFGFMDENEGEWKEDFESVYADEYDLEIGVGRLPVKTVEEATTVVDKIIHYHTTTNGQGTWKQRVVFVADDGDNNTHQEQADELAAFVENTYPGLNPYRLFVDDFEKVSTANGALSPYCRQALNEAVVNQGALVMNYSGHGSISAWTSERILETTELNNWSNIHKLPLLLTATCEFGRYDDPTISSGAEQAILSPKGGAIALLTTTRPVVSYTNFKLNKAFYSVLFGEEVGDEMPRLGDIIRMTKNGSLSGVSNRNFTLLGDPSMRLVYPEERAYITHVNGALLQDSDTLQALEKVVLSGEVQSGSNLSTDFNGKVNVTVYEKKSRQQTLGNDGPETVFEYDARKNIIFRGEATVKNGLFEVGFVVPKDIRYKFGEGKVSLYAYVDSANRDASGFSDKVVVGGSTINAETDNTAPEISLFMNNESFKNGGVVRPDALLLAKLKDENGINISGIGLGHDITLWLDGEEYGTLNEYFSTTVDDYTSGEIAFPMTNLSEGVHELELIAWDTYNNEASARISFTVSEDEMFNFTANVYPNPADELINFRLNHDYGGEDLEIGVDILSISGQVIATMDKTVYNAEESVEIQWNRQMENGGRLIGGLYLCKVSIRGTNSGLSGMKVMKLILNN